jgi:hypothetical protein
LPLGWPAGPANLHGLEWVLRSWAAGLEGDGLVDGLGI